MFGLPIEQFTTIAQFLGVALVGLLWVLGGRWGAKTQTPDEKTVEVAGALVDASSVKLLAGAIEAQTLEMTTRRAEGEKARAVSYRALEMAGKLVGEIEELRGEIRHLGDALRRRG